MRSICNAVVYLAPELWIKSCYTHVFTQNFSYILKWKDTVLHIYITTSNGARLINFVLIMFFFFDRRLCDLIGKTHFLLVFSHVYIRLCGGWGICTFVSMYIATFLLHSTGPPVNVTCNIFINSFGSVTETTMVSAMMPLAREQQYVIYVMNTTCQFFYLLFNLQVLL